MNVIGNVRRFGNVSVHTSVEVCTESQRQAVTRPPFTRSYSPHCREIEAVSAANQWHRPRLNIARVTRKHTPLVALGYVAKVMAVRIAYIGLWQE